jgi:hypothetical protein
MLIKEMFRPKNFYLIYRSLMANVKGTVGTSAEERRYSAIGICLNKILASGLRKAIAEEFQDWYNILTQPPTEIDKQVYGEHLETLPGTGYRLHYENINDNAVHKFRTVYNLSVHNPLSLAKLCVQPYMARFTGFDETMDLSAVLAIMSVADLFVKCGATVLAKRVRSEIKIRWDHSHLSIWTNDKFNLAIDDMQSLVRSTNLSDAEKKEMCDELQYWRDKGISLNYSEFIIWFQVEYCKIQNGDRYCSITGKLMFSCRIC